MVRFNTVKREIKTYELEIPEGYVRIDPSEYRWGDMATFSTQDYWKDYSPEDVRQEVFRVNLVCIRKNTANTAKTFDIPNVWVNSQSLKVTMTEEVAKNFLITLRKEFPNVA